MVKKNYFLSIVFLFILSSEVLCCVFHIELPEHITEEMYIEGSYEVIDEITDKMVEELKVYSETDPSSAAIVIFTKNGETIGGINPDMIEDDVDVDNLSLNEGDKGWEIEFRIEGENWTSEQKKDVEDFLYYVDGDEEGVDGVYWMARKLLGYSNFTDHKVKLYLIPDEDIGYDYVWSPRPLYRDSSTHEVYPPSS